MRSTRASKASRSPDEGRAAGSIKAAEQGGARAVDPRYIVPGLSRGLALLSLFTRDNPLRSLSELAGDLHLSRSAAYRLVYTLEKEGFLVRDPDRRRYRVTAKILALGFEYLHSQSITETAQPTLRALSERTRAAAHVAVLEGWHSVYLSRVAPAVTLVTNLQVGMRLPAHVTASGRMLIAQLDADRLAELFETLKRECHTVPQPRSLAALRRLAEEDRQRGYVYHGSAFDPGVLSIAAPVFDRTGTALAAITVVGSKPLFEELGGERKLARLVVEAAHGLSRQMGHSPEHA